MSLLVSFRDADMYDRDRQLFRPGMWLNDSCINYCYRKIEAEVSNEAILLVEPATMSFLRLQCEYEEEFSDLREGLSLGTRKFCLLPLNDNTSFDEASTQWRFVSFNSFYYATNNFVYRLVY